MATNKPARSLERTEDKIVDLFSDILGHGKTYRFMSEVYGKEVKDFADVAGLPYDDPMVLGFGMGLERAAMRVDGRPLEGTSDEDSRPLLSRQPGVAEAN